MMKFRILFIFCLALLVPAGHAFSQSAKEKRQRKKGKKTEASSKAKDKKKDKEDKKNKKKEYKMWKSRAKQYAKKPMSLKSLVEAKQESDQRAADFMGEAESLRASVGKKDARIKELEGQVAQVSGKMASMKSNLDKLRASPPPSRGKDYSKGVFFKVQIGSFKTRDLSKYFENNPNFAGEVTESGSQRVTIGIFSDYWEADAFKKQMREIGVRDAWIVPYRDGQRVDIKDVMTGISEEP